MSANEVGWAFTGADCATGCTATDSSESPQSTRTPAAKRPRRAIQPEGEQEIKRCAGTPRVHRVPAHASRQITVDTVISTFLADALPRSSA